MNPSPVTPYIWERPVDFVETDMAGIVHFSNFFRFMEAAETAFMRSVGHTVFATGEDARTFPRVSASCDYHSPVRFMDQIRVEVTIERMTNKSISYRFRIGVRVGTNGETRSCADGRIVTVCCQVTPEGLRSTPIPLSLRQAVQDAGVIEASE